MFKNIVSLILFIFLCAFGSQAVALTDPICSEKKKIETDSLNSNKNKNRVISTEVKAKSVSTKSESTSINFWKKTEEVEEDSTSNSALSFNFIYYIIEKFKFQVE